MHLLDLAALLLSLAALFGYLNHRFIGLSAAIETIEPDTEFSQAARGA